jgi:16S rRNA (cytidine1402-2'-O)-methyltransferase
MAVQSATSTGTLYIIATPIGNCQDISQRAIRTLQEVDLILSEDTRHSGNLLKLLGIQNSLRSLHAHNELAKTKDLIDLLLAGKSLALISDAGTPLISDPGFPLVKAAHENNIVVSPIPGPSALITALSAAGVPCDSFTFIGFLPAKSSARIARLSECRTIPHTLIFYESTHRIVDSIKDVAEVFGPLSPLVLAKELTKTYETFVRGTCDDVLAWLGQDSGHKKGEFVIIIPPRVVESSQNLSSLQLLSLLLTELTVKQAVKVACAITQENKNELYKAALTIKNTSPI